MKYVVVLFGAPGIGKTTVAKYLYQRIEDSQYVDVDDLWRIHPFVVNQDSKKLVESNLRHLYQSFMDHPTLKHLIVTWVIPTEDLKRRLTSWMHKSQLFFYRLVANEDVYMSRLKSGARNKEKYDEYLDILRVGGFHDVKNIDTSHKSIPQVVDAIYNDYLSINKETLNG